LEKLQIRQGCFYYRKRKSFYFFCSSKGENCRHSYFNTLSTHEAEDEEVEERKRKRKRKDLKSRKKITTTTFLKMKKSTEKKNI